jgi:hypothetical protein
VSSKPQRAKPQRAKPRPPAKASQTARAERPATAERPAAEIEKIASLDRPRRTSVPRVVEPEQPEQPEQPVELEPTAATELVAEPEAVAEAEAAADDATAEQGEAPVADDVAADTAAVDTAAAAQDARSMAGRPRTVADTLAQVDTYWHAFQALALRFPRTRIDEPLGRSWTRKQMLAHVAAWHDRTTDRLLAFVKSGAIQPLADEVDTFNARVARAAIGRTSGEVVGALEASFNRLRRQIDQLTDEQLRAHDGWAAAIIAGNTYDHYDEHAADLHPAGLSSAP